MAALLLGIVALGRAGVSDRFGSIGVTYTLAANTVRYNFRLDSAAFATEYMAKDGHIFAPRGRKLLLVKYTVGNPESWSLSINRDLVQLGVIDDPTKTPGLGGARSLEFQTQRQDLGPGKSYSDTAYVEIANENQTPQLLVRVGGSPDTLRYDLSTRVKGQTGPFALQHGLVASDDAPAKVGEALPIGAFEVALERASLGRTPVRVRLPDGLNGEEINPSTDQRILIANVRIKNRSRSDQALGGSIHAEIFDASGMKGPLPVKILTKENALLEGSLRPGSTASVQVIFLLPRDFTPSSITLYDQVGGRRSMTVKKFIK